MTVAAVVAVVFAVDASPAITGAEKHTITPVERPAPLRIPCCDYELAPGTYVAPVDESAAFPYTVTFPAGWKVLGGNEFYRHTEAPDAIGILPYVVTEIYADACQGDKGTVTKVGPRVQDLVEALRAQPGPAKSTPVQTTLGGYPATRIDLRVPESVSSRNCFLGPGTGVQVWNSPQSRYLVLPDQGLTSVYVVDAGGQRPQVFVVQYDPAHVSAADREDLQQVLASLRIRAPRR